VADDVLVRPLTPELVPDFFVVQDDDPGSPGCGWCHCVAWYVPTWDGWTDRTAAQNRALRDSLFARGEYDGYLIHVAGVPAGWCQVGLRDRLPKLVRTYGLDPDPDVYAVSCFEMRPAFRGRGFAHRLLAGVVDDLARRGVAHVQAFPRPSREWTGPQSLFEKAGFVVEREGRLGRVYGRRLVTPSA
jgi:ribosomal protein S18 acetylase RimI-like enzyme